MEYKLTLQMDIAVIDDNYTNIIKHKRKKPIGNPTSITGTEDEIIDKINKMVYDLIDLSSDIYIKGEESVTI